MVTAGRQCIPMLRLEDRGSTYDIAVYLQQCLWTDPRDKPEDDGGEIVPQVLMESLEQVATALVLPARAIHSVILGLVPRICPQTSCVNMSAVGSSFDPPYADRAIKGPCA